MRTVRSTFLLLIITIITAAPAAAADDDPSGPAPRRRPKGVAAPGVGMEPSEVILHEAPLSVPGSDEEEASSGDMRFQFHGYLRVPMRLGIGDGDDVPAGVERGKKLHIPPLIPDGSYIDWRYINNMGGPWTELQLTYGNNKVSANVAIATYDITDGSYGSLVSQLGINQAFVSLSFPDLFGRVGGLVANVGVFSNRYGAASRYSADKYDTYLFGATHVAGENLRAFFDVGRHFTLHIEQGFGGKLNVTPFDTTAAADSPHLPYGGPEQQGTTLLNHAHLGISYDDRLTIAGHYLSAWTQDATLVDQDDGRITNIGADIKLIDFFFGEAYLGYSHIISETPVRMAGALEFMHTTEGWNFIDNWFMNDDGTTTNGSGKINSILFQYSFSLARALWHPREYWGQARDLRFMVFGMFNAVESDDSAFDGSTNRLKYGGNITYMPVKWLGIQARYDLVQPNLENNTLSFHVLTGGLIFRTDFVSHEQIVLGYTHYFYGDNVTPVWPNEAMPPDADIIKISAIMWW